ncbi:MAG: hypothetical protein WBI07_05755 [Mobilitalea sp.]
MRLSYKLKIPKAEFFKRILFFLLGCILTASLIWGYNYWSSSTKTMHYLFNAEVIDFSDDVLTVKGLSTNTAFTQGTYLIKITNKIFLKDWETERTLEWDLVNGYKYVVVEYIGSEIVKDNSYLKGINSIYCNVDERIPYED